MLWAVIAFYAIFSAPIMWKLFTAQNPVDAQFRKGPPSPMSYPEVNDKITTGARYVGFV